MPEGWKRINQSISEYKTTTDTERMLDLLKEMAEALECVKMWQVQSSNYKDTGLLTTRAFSEEDIQNTKEQFAKLHNDEVKEAVKALNRFKEWE